MGRAVKVYFNRKESFDQEKTLVCTICLALVDLTIINLAFVMWALPRKEITVVLKNSSLFVIFTCVIGCASDSLVSNVVA